MIPGRGWTRQRTAALHDLVDALNARARASGGGFADEYVARLRELDEALSCLERATGVEPVPTLFRVVTAKARGHRAVGLLAALPFAELAPDDEQATADAQEPLRRTLSWLRDAVVGPVLDHLRGLPGGAARVWWVPTGLLAALPPHAAALGLRAGPLPAAPDTVGRVRPHRPVGPAPPSPARRPPGVGQNRPYEVRAADLR